MSETPHVAILGSGPTGIEAALTAVDHGLGFTLYEAGPRVADSMRNWGHVRLFSPWDLDASPRMRRYLESAGRSVPSGDACPTGRELAEGVLVPLAELPALTQHIRLGQEVISIGREGLLKHEAIGVPERGGRRFRLLLRGADGGESLAFADAVLDCTGTYRQPNALGDGGIAAPGEGSFGRRIVRHIPDVLTDAAAWKGQTILLVGAGHSAQTAVQDLAVLAEQHPGTRILWALRGEPHFQPIPDDALPERSGLIVAAGELAGGSSPAVETLTGVVVDAIEEDKGGEGERLRVRLRHRADGSSEHIVVDRVLSLTGYVGDHQMYRQLQVHECYATSGPMKLAAALLGESSSDCLAQASHGADTLKNPEPGFYILGAKSYGRNTTFLMRTGWEQVEEVFGLLKSELRVGESVASAAG